jgi:hypothetical protein
MVLEVLNPGETAGDQNVFRRGHITMSRVASIATGLLTVAFVGLVTSAASAAICQGKSMTLDEIADVLKAASSCDASMKIFQDCSLSSSGDLRLGDAVRERCEVDFLSKLQTPQKHVYEREVKACNGKYRDQSGTMYRSWEGFCAAEVAQRYSQRALKRSR